MKNLKTTIIITSISAPNAVLKSFADESKKQNIDFIVIGDVKTPADFKLDGCKYYSISDQENLNFRLGKSLPKKHYSRKNIGYLLAKNQDVIIETDDDNFPRADFWNQREKNVTANCVNQNGWVNVYKYFSKEAIWPRGYPLEYLSLENPLPGKNPENVLCPIQQGLADQNPDVDAVYRMTQKLPIDFEKRSPVVLGKNSWCPFNSQNTTWFKEAFPLLYLPSYCSFRMTDIWRSFIAQRIAWTCGWSVLFHTSTVWQERNEHSLLKDFEDEVPGYLNNARICRLLEELDLKSGIINLGENLIRCYKMMVENNFVDRKEMKLVDDWIEDIGAK
jgi:hypothetical protein